MKGVIETLKFTDSNGEKYNLYPRTLIECISNQNGDSLEDTLQQYIDTQFSDTYADKTYVAEQIAASNHLTREIVTEIPTAETAKDNVIYMYKVDSASGNDVYQEYQLIGGEVVLVGDTSVDLSNYVQSEELDGYLKTTGGKTTGSLYVRDNATTQFVVEHTNGNTPQIAFNGTDGRLGSVLYDAKNGSLKRINGDTTSSYTILDSGNYSDYALPKNADGSVGSGLVSLTLKGDYSSNYLNFLTSGGTLLGLIGYQDANTLVFRNTSNQNYSILHSGNVGSYALPIGGGTIMSYDAQYVPLRIRAMADAIYPTSILSFSHQDTWLGNIGFYDMKPVVCPGDKSAFTEILHTGNKPTGSYVGTGASRTITTNSLSSIFVIMAVGSDDFAIVTPGGYIAASGNTVIRGTDVETSSSSHNIIINTSSAIFNASGKTYDYFSL